MYGEMPAGPQELLADDLWDMLSHLEFLGDRPGLCTSYRQNGVKEQRKSSFDNLTNHFLKKKTISLFKGKLIGHYYLFNLILYEKELNYVQQIQNRYLSCLCFLAVM